LMRGWWGRERQGRPKITRRLPESMAFLQDPKVMLLLPHNLITILRGGKEGGKHPRV
jgi:hypothetical protein